MRRNHGEGIMGEESLERNEREIKEEESWERNHGRGIMEEASWEATGRHLGGIWEASGRHLGGIWEASGAKGVNEGKMCQIYCVLQWLWPRPTISCESGEGDPHDHTSMYFTCF